MSEIRHVQSPIVHAGRGAASRASGLIPMAFALIIGAVFVYAGAVKAWDPVKFATDIANFHILPWPVGVRLAFYLPWLEILCGVALIIGWMRTGAIAILTALTVIFLCASVAAKARGIDLNCGCFGSATKNLSFTWHLVIDLAFLIGLLALWLRASRSHSPARP